jgi:hypothetical protein
MVRCAVPGPVYFNGLPQDLYLYWEAGHEASAAAAADWLNRELQRKVAEARELSYQQGWRDAKAKRAKRDTFSGWLF